MSDDTPAKPDGPGALEVVLLYQPSVREEARRLAKGLRAFPDQARSLLRRKLAALEAAAEVLELIAGPEMPQRRPGNLGVRRLRPGNLGVRRLRPGNLGVRRLRPGVKE